MNIFTLRNDLSTKMLGLLALASLLLTSLPFGVMTAFAARTGVTVSAHAGTTAEIDVPIHLQAQIQNDSDGGEPATLSLSDGGAGGEFSNASESGCSATWSPVTEFNIATSTNNKNFCYKNVNAGTHTVSVQLSTSTGDVGSPATIEVTVTGPVPPPPPPSLDSFPSTNDANRDASRPHVNFVSDAPGSITLEFRNDTNSLAYFEIRIDGVEADSSRPLHPNPCKLEADPLHNACNGLRYLVEDERSYGGGVTVDNRNLVSGNPNPNKSNLEEVTFSASDTVEVRLALGGERDWDFDWTLFNVPAPLPPKTEVTVIVTGDTSAGENQPGWLFGRDVRTSTPFVFTDSQASIGNGSLYVLPITNTNTSGFAPNDNWDKFIAEYFALTEMGDITSFSYDFNIGSGGTSADANHFYLNVYANFGDSDNPTTNFYDCRYNVVPTTGAVGGWTTVTFNPTDSYPVSKWGSSTSPHSCPASPADMGSDAVVRAFAINLGDTSANDTGLDGYFDKVVFETGTHITTYDFEADTEAPTVTDVVLNGQDVDNAHIRIANCESIKHLYPVSGLINLEATIEDALNDVESAWYRVRKVNANGCSNSGVFSSGKINLYENAGRWSANEGSEFDTSVIEIDGAYTIMLVTKDTAGNEQTRYIDIEINNTDTTAPIVNISNPSNEAKVSGNLEVMGTVTDDVALSHYVVTLYPGTTNLSNGLPHGSAISVPGWGLVNTSTTSASFIRTLDTTSLTDGEYQIRVAARDAAGNREVSDPYTGNTTSVHVVKIVVDNTAPSVPVITHPVDGQIFSSTPILNQWTTSTDDSGIAKYQIAYRYDDGHTFGNSTCSGETIDGDWVGCRDVNGTSRNHTPGINEQGGVTIWVRAIDEVGNVSDWSDPVHYYYFVSGTLPDNENDNGGGDTTPTTTFGTTIVSPADMNGWAFALDSGTTGEGEMVSGPTGQPLGSGSARLSTLAANDGSVLGVALYSGTRLDQIEELKYSTYRTSGSPAQAIALQFNIDADLTDSEVGWQGRLVYEPYYTETVTTGVWQEWNTLTQGRWWFSNGTLASLSGCSISTPCTWAQVLSAFPNAGVHDSLGGVLFKAGSSWAGFDGNVDNFVIGIKTGNNTHTETYDFEPTLTSTPEDEITPQGVGGGPVLTGASTPAGEVQGASISAPEGEVLGASTVAGTCGMYLLDYMSINNAPSVWEVMKLQLFLLSKSIFTFTPGVFGATTETSVRAYQTANAEAVLQPWITAGLADSSFSATGIVGKTTRWHINNAVCPGSEVFPQLP